MIDGYIKVWTEYTQRLNEFYYQNVRNVQQ